MAQHILNDHSKLSLNQRTICSLLRCHFLGFLEFLTMQWLNLIVFAYLIAMATSAGDKKVVCYFASWSVYRPGVGRFAIEDINATLCTHYIYAFVGLENNQVKILDPWQALPDGGGQDGFAKFNHLRNKNPGVKTMVGIGGWNEGSRKYSIMASSPNSREIFVNSAVKFLKRYSFDGLDINWEYPNQRGGKLEDVKNFVLLLKELRIAFDKENLLLSAGVAAAKSSATKSYNIEEIWKYLDFINVLTYDLHGNWDSRTGLIAPLYQGSTDSAYDREITVDASIKYWLSKGVSTEKLILGVPSYGQTFTLSDVNRNGVGAPTKGPGEPGPYTGNAGTLGYNEICTKIEKAGWIRHFDEERIGPYLYSGDQWIGYDDPQSVGEKAAYVNRLDLGGVLIWSIDTDDFRGNCGAKYPLIGRLKHILDHGFDG
ncbi:acidic mammalian chitinase-like [Venturia canescens]|uniref:acidic mammalian chitinase-like n=1 Tax=Venturia canescens TaxID=32260 RepID=UPI001C9CF174|nr:acidic mammalian chitinase-like [Venturia canescens]